MVSPHSTQLRCWITLLLLLHLVALLLPASAGSAAAQADTCAGDTVQSATVVAQAMPAANQEVKIPAETVDAALFEANWRYHYQEGEAVAELLYAMLLANSQGSQADVQALEQVRTRVEAAIPPAELNNFNLFPADLVIHTILDEAYKTPELSYVVPAVHRSLTSLQLNLTLHNASSAVAESAQRYTLGNGLLDRTQEVLKAVGDCAKQKPAVAKAFDERHKKRLKVSIRDRAKKVIEQNPELPILNEIRDRLGEDGTIIISINQLTALSVTEFGKLHESIADMQKTLNVIDAKQDVIIDYLKNQQEKEKMQELAKKKAEENKLKLDAIQSSISIISTLVGKIDPKLGKQIAVIGASSLKVGLAVHGWLKAVSGLGALNKVFSLSTVVMTGNVLGAVMDVIGLFSAGQPTPEQMILAEIGKLRQQVEQLRVEMHDRFDRIDKGLNAIYTTMHDRFDQIDIQLGNINGNILEVQQSLVELDLKLSRIERNNFELINAEGRRPLLEAVNGGLGYRKRIGSAMPKELFAHYENQFHSWATIHAFDPGNVGPTQRDYSDTGLLTELTTYPLDANLNYINNWLVLKGLPAIANKRLPSTRDWLLASRAYTQFSLEEPAQMAIVIQNDPQRHAQLLQIGAELEQAMRNLSTLASATGPQGNSLLFSNVITYYQSKVDGLDGEIQKLEGEFLNTLRAKYKRDNQPGEVLFSLYGGLDQPLSYQTTEVANITCGDPTGHGTFPATNNLRALIPNFDRYNLAEYLQEGAIAVCLSDQWLDPRRICDPPDPPSPPNCYEMAQHKAILTVYFNSVSIMSQTITEDDKFVPPSPADFSRAYWTFGDNYKAQFEGLPTVDAPTPELAAQRAALLNTITTNLETKLAEHQHALYQQVVNEMAIGSLKPPATMLAGSKLLLEDLITLGLPRAVSSDEFVHAMLYGDQQLVDGNQILQTYALSKTQPITGANLLINPRLVIGQVADQRRAVFTGMVNDYLNAITAQTHAEGADYVASTRRTLALTMRIIGSTTPAPGDPKQLYLPLIAR